MTVYSIVLPQSTVNVDIIPIFHISARVGREKMCNKAEMFMGISSRAESSNIYTSEGLQFRIRIVWSGCNSARPPPPPTTPLAK